MPPFDPARVFRYSGWSAYASAGLSITSGTFLLLFYALEVPRMAVIGADAPQTFGTLNDIATLFQFLCMLPLTVALHRLAPPDRRVLSLIGVAVGVVGLLGVVIAQALLVAGVLTFEVNLPFVMAAFGLFGVWMISANGFAQVTGRFPSGLARLGVLTGIAFVLMSAVTLLVILLNWRDPSAAGRLGAILQQEPALIAIAIVLAVPLFLAFFAAVPLWLIGVGRRLLAIAAVAQGQSDRLPAPAGTPPGHARP